MNFISTRGNSPAVSASAAILRGLAPDGGLYVPETIPACDMSALLGLSYKETAEKVLRLYLSDFTDEEISFCVNNAYTQTKFGGEDPAPIHTLRSGKHILELWHGPTCAFKDMALQMLPHLLSVSLKKQKEERTAVILVATSGDTGKAALEGFCDAESTKILVFYPSDGVSDMQKLQMITQKGNNVASCGIVGNFDDAQSGVKTIFADAQMRDMLDQKKCFLSSANSINFGRLLPQIVYYIHGYLKLVSAGHIHMGDKIDVCVPTGNFGNILAAYMASRMGLPIEKFVCASNANDVLTEFINTGIYNKNREFHATISPSMDILISSNLERMLWYLYDGDCKAVAALMEELKDFGTYAISEKAFAKLSKLFIGDSIDEDGTCEVIKNTWEKDGYVCDTHTAVALGACRKADGKNPMLVASTASPFKFASSVLRALGETPDADEFVNLERLEKGYGVACPASLGNLKSMEIRFPQVIDRTEMADRLLNFVK